MIATVLPIEKDRQMLIRTIGSAPWPFKNDDENFLRFSCHDNESLDAVVVMALIKAEI